jgi:hypothetical protein
MAKFVYGALPRTLKAKGYLPGHITSAFGPRYVAAGILKAGETAVEFGEFVELESNTSKSYIAKVVDAGTAVAQLGVVVRDVVGSSLLTNDEGDNNIVAFPKKNVPLSLFIQTAGNKSKIVAILAASQTPAVGGQVFVGRGTGSTVAGVLYTAAQGSAGVDTIATDWKFASLKFQPTEGAGEAVEVEYAG